VPGLIGWQWVEGRRLAVRARGGGPPAVPAPELGEPRP
jgi:hypothetical protein